MDAIQYLKNQMILENCKEYLSLLDFLPDQDGIWSSIHEFNPTEVSVSQNFKSTKNCVEIIFCIRNNSWENCELTLRAKIINNSLSRISISKIGLEADRYSYLARKVDFMNNDVCKVVDYFEDEDYRVVREEVSYYVRKILVHTSSNKSVLNKRVVINTEFVEQATPPACGRWYHDVFYERDYMEDICYRENYFEEKEKVSHNQFEKKNKGVLKRIKKLGQTLEK